MMMFQNGAHRICAKADAIQQHTQEQQVPYLKYWPYAAWQGTCCIALFNQFQPITSP
jgi:hypothetical protein